MKTKWGLDKMRYRKPFALAASAVMMAGAAAANPAPVQAPELDVTVIQQDLGGDMSHMLVPVMMILLMALTIGGSNGSSTLTYR